MSRHEDDPDHNSLEWPELGEIIRKRGAEEGTHERQRNRRGRRGRRDRGGRRQGGEEGGRPAEAAGPKQEQDMGSRRGGGREEQRQKGHGQKGGPMGRMGAGRAATQKVQEQTGEAQRSRRNAHRLDGMILRVLDHSKCSRTKQTKTRSTHCHFWRHETRWRPLL